jgi:flagellar export protein FliJ
MLAKFQFRLQPLLDCRQRVEEEKQRQAAAVSQILAECEGELARLAAIRETCVEKIVESAYARSGWELGLRDAHLRSVDAALRARSRNCGDFRTEQRRAHDDLVAARRERRVIEALKERRYRAFTAQRELCDERELDEANARCREKCETVIALTRLNGQPVMLNCDLIESIESNGETIVTLTTGNAVVVLEPMQEIERRVVAFKRKIYAAQHD